MAVWVEIAQAAVGLNVLLLGVLSVIWGRNYYDIRSKHTLGLLLFSVFLLGENVLTLYYYLVDPDLSVWFSSGVPAIAWRAMMLLHVFETLGLAFLTWVTLD